MDDFLITLDDIAAMHKCDAKHARDIIVRKPGFPNPVPTSSARKRLWLKDAVLRYVTGADYAQTTHSAVSSS